MKIIKPFVLLALTISGAILHAQKPIIVTEDTVSFKDAKYPGLVVSIPEYNFETVQKNWVRELQSGTKSKVVSENKEMTIFGANIKKISPNPINIYSKFINRDTLLLLMLSFELSKDKYIEKASGENELTQAKVFLRQFAKDQYVESINDELKSKNKNLKDLKSELESLQNKKLRIQKSIQSNKTDITEAKDNITILNNEIAKFNEILLAQNNQLISLQPGAVKNEKADSIESTEKKRKKALNDVESIENKNTKRNSEIKQFEDDIIKNESDQEVMKGKIKKQELVVDLCEEKLKTVKNY